ncbi:MAG: DUF885 domain-containing protein [Gammaproteobacteria bacterium]|nr:DUF885 domain-containing protein [Gammaproteobacteria bacterium]
MKLLRIILAFIVISALGPAIAADWNSRLADAAAVPGADDRVKALMDLYWDWQLDQFPELSTLYGEPGDHGRWTDDSADAIEARRKFQRALLSGAESIPGRELSLERQLDYTLFRDQLQLTVAGFAFPEELMPLNQMGGVQQDAAHLLAIMPARTRTDFDAILSRLSGLPKVIRQHVALLKQGLKRSITPPRVTLRDVPGQLDGLLTEDPFKSPLLGSFSEMPAGMDGDEWTTLRKRAETIYRNDLDPAFRELRRFLEKDYLPGARKPIALAALPGGREWYRHRVRAFTTTNLAPREIHELGLREVARIRSRMDEIIRSTGFAGTFADFTHFLRTDPKFFHTQPDDLIREYRDISKRADAGLPALFGTLPRNTYGVIPVPDFSAKSQTTAYYQEGALKAGRPAYFFANTYDLKMRPRWEMEALTLHEAVPGHHLQISIAQELPDVHPLRRHGGYTAFVEGWGLYAESLGEEMGFYQDPYGKFGQLTYEMWRAIRLVVDTGMHSEGWSREQAIKYFMNNSAKTAHDITVEIDRYIVWPGQALAYKLGELKLKELRARARESLGDQFNVRVFHDRVLEAGALPLNVLEERINAWLAGGGK